MFTGLIMTLLFLSTLAAMAYDVDQEEGAHRLHSYKENFRPVQQFLDTDGTII